MVKKRITNHEEFMENMNILHPELKIIGTYQAAKIPLIVETKYGQCEVRPDNLNQGQKPHIMSAVNPTEYWINMAREVHGNRYDYSLVNYTINRNNVDIICERHGKFPQIAGNHLNGDNCPDCETERTHKVATKSTEQFIKEANEKHNNEFTYENVDYINAHTKVWITCNKHGDFPMSPRKHLNGQKCRYCKPERVGKACSDTLEKFLYKANKKHKNYYSYPFTDYKNGKDVIPIKCPKHNIFYKIASAHLGGTGCNECAKELQGWRDSQWEAQAVRAGRQNFCKVYIIKCSNKETGEEFYKIGKTFNELSKRFKSKTALPYYYVLIKETYGSAKYICKLERTYHKAFKKYRYLPQLKFKGYTECFKW